MLDLKQNGYYPFPKTWEGSDEVRAFNIIQALCEKGCKAYLTGGAVRDLFLGIDPKDHDIVTEATIEQLHDWFPEKSTKSFGKSFLITTIRGIDVAGFRIDVHDESGELLEVVPAMTIEEDLGRRDLTFNAMAFCPYTNELIDPYNGKDDLDNKIIRFTGDAYKRIQEDPCRIIRACRFVARINGKFADSTFQALKDNVQLIRKIKFERIQKEILSAMSYEKPSLFFRALNDIGALEYIFPSMFKCLNVNGGREKREDVFDHLMMCGDSITPKKPLLRLTGYLHDVGKPDSMKLAPAGHYSFIGHEIIGEIIVRKELKRLKFSSDHIDYVSNLTTTHMREILHVKPKTMRKLVSILKGHKIDWKDFILLRIADRNANAARPKHTKEQLQEMILGFYRTIKDKKSIFSMNDLAIDGSDIMKITNTAPGRHLKIIKEYLFNYVLEFPEWNTKESLTSLVQNMDVMKDMIPEIQTTIKG